MSLHVVVEAVYQCLHNTSSFSVYKIRLCKIEQGVDELESSL